MAYTLTTFFFAQVAGERGENPLQCRYGVLPFFIFVPKIKSGGESEYRACASLSVYCTSMRKHFFLARSGLGVVVFVAAAVPFLFLLGNTNPSIQYLTGKSLSPWSIMALFAVGESPPLDSLKTISLDKAIDLEAPILALTAAGKDPRIFGSIDLIAKLKSFYDGVQLGEAGIVNDDIFGLLALIASGEKTDSATVLGIRNFILSKQNVDGGFSFAIGGGSDTNTTAAAIMALRAAGASVSDPILANAAGYLKSAQNDDGGFPYDPKSSWGTASDASSDAWVIMALRALGEDVALWQKEGKTPVTHLETLKQEGGFYLYQAGGQEDSFTPVTTSYAVLALGGKTFPVRVIAPEVLSEVSFSFRIEGRNQSLCSGESEGVVALDAVKAAAEQCGLSYHLVSSALGEYVDEIAGEKAAGASGWMYAVNASVPSVGAGAYRLSQDDSVFWYFGTFGEEPKYAEVPLEVIIPEQESGGGIGSGDTPAGAVSLIVETGNSPSAPLGFGTVARGAIASRQVTVRNSGASAVLLSPSISGDAIFRRFLLLNERSWRMYRAALGANAATTTALSIAVPVDYPKSGKKVGTLIFWATPIAQ